MMAIVAAADKLPLLDVAIFALHYSYPALAFFTFVTALTITVCTLQTRSLRAKDQHVRRDVIIGLLGTVVALFLGDTITILVVSFREPQWSPPQDQVVYLIASMLVYGLQLLVLFDTKFPVWYPYYSTWFLAIAMETALLLLSTIYRHPTSSADFVLVTLQTLRVLTFISLPSSYFGVRNSQKTYDNDDAERQALLQKKLAPKGSSSENGNGYGGTGSAEQTKTTGKDSKASTDSEDSWLAGQRKAQELIAKRLQNDGNWWTYAKGFSVFFPHIWPVHSKRLQVRAALVGCCLLASNALNVLVPRQLGIMIDTLRQHSTGDTSHNVWLPVFTYTIFLFISGGACIGWLKKWLWLPLEQYSYDALSTASHAHIMSLSSDFHDNKTSSDLSQAIAGGRSVADLLETICFQIIPMLIDLTLAFVYLWSLFGPYMGFFMATTVITYLYATTKLVATRAEKRRQFIAVYRKEWTVGHQSLDGWNTASLFNMIPHEKDRYQCAVKDHLKSKRTYELSSQAITATQGLIMSCGLLGALYLAVYQVVHGKKTVGQFATLLTYWAQLQGPLQMFSSIYRTISYSLMDAERLLELFQTKPSIVDAPNAKPLNLSKGMVEFDQVSFSYDERKPTLKNVSFVVPPSQTVALVGETGGGKSTILKLIDRFYDVKSGSIRIDSQDLRDVTLESIRSRVGVVPQDPMLFNDSIMNNLRYARLTASDTEVYEACKAAAIHDKIMSFPDGYDSRVGDRGVKLSGGEKQRVAIARAMLKQPEIILLDEATSAVDTETEQMIQEGLRVLCNQRTTFIVAHRLSTIMRANIIFVVMNGEIVEVGSHEELLSLKGRYFDLWTKQVFLKPTVTDRARSRSPKKQCNIVNDLSPAIHKAEIQKANVQHKAIVKSKRQGKIGTADGNLSEDEMSLVQEGSKLKPEAPEFVPRSSDGDIKSPKLKEAHPHIKLHRNSTENSSSAIGSSDMTTDFDNPESEDKKRRTRAARRQQAKSEPGRAQEYLDGTQDSGNGLGSSGEVTSTSQTPAQHRRVSAPSDPPGASQEVRNNRKSRNRHWRLRNRAAENGSTSNLSTMTSGDASSDNSHAFEAHNTTPAEPKASSTGTVRFAPID